MIRKKLIRVCLLGLILLLTAGVSHVFSSGGKESTAPGTEEVYKFTHAYNWDLSRGRISVAEQPNDPYWQYVAKTLGVVPLTTAWDWEGGDTYNKMIRLHLASGEIPEAFRPNTLELTQELIREGILLPLDDLLKTHGKDLYAAYTEDNWDMARALAPDGKIYWIPNYWNVFNSRGGFIRKDWLDRVGLDVPKTRDELVTMYKAFRDKDANGNGDPNDEIPVSGRNGMRWCDDLFMMHGVAMFEGYPEWRWNAAEGRLISDQVSDEMRNAIEFIRMLVEEKLMDKVMPIQSRADWAAKINDGRVGHYFHLVSRLEKYSAFMKDDPNADWAYMRMVSVPGVPPQQTYLIRGNYSDFAITKKARQPEKIMEWFNWVFTDEGSKFMRLGIPGVDWTEGGGKIKALKTDRSDYIYVPRHGKYIPEAARMEALGELKMKLLKPMEGQVSYTMDSVGMPHSVFEGHQDFLPNKAKLYREYCSKMILGEKPMSAWDEYVKKWYDAGGEVVTRRATEWYKKSKGM